MKNKHLKRIKNNNYIVRRLKNFIKIIKNDLTHLDYKLDIDLLRITHIIGLYSCNDYRFHKECRRYVRNNIAVRVFLNRLSSEYNKLYGDLCVFGEVYNGSDKYNINPELVDIINNFKEYSLIEITDVFGIRYGKDIFNLLKNIEF